jgi:hypothetical protein
VWLKCGWFVDFVWILSKLLCAFNTVTVCASQVSGISATVVAVVQ